MNFLQMSHTNKILIGWKCHIRPEDKRGGKVEKSCCYFLYLLRNRYISIEDKHSLKKKKGGETEGLTNAILPGCMDKLAEQQRI